MEQMQAAPVQMEALETPKETVEAPAYPQVIYVPVPVNPQEGMENFAFPQGAQPFFFNPYLMKPTSN
jgi:hypothetical protein